ncbi:MAG TPA: hypothetical protein VN408_13400 [Actinoplanes sp.]|nr:hypothetical protein [Actinoplanes sp.]
MPVGLVAGFTGGWIDALLDPAHPPSGCRFRPCRFRARRTGPSTASGQLTADHYP